MLLFLLIFVDACDDVVNVVMFVCASFIFDVAPIDGVVIVAFFVFVDNVADIFDFVHFHDGNVCEDDDGGVVVCGDKTGKANYVSVVAVVLCQWCSGCSFFWLLLVTLPM